MFQVVESPRADPFFLMLQATQDNALGHLLLLGKSLHVRLRGLRNGYQEKDTHKTSRLDS